MQIDRKFQYEKYPEIKITGFEREVFDGYGEIIEELKSKIRKTPFVLVVDCYPGVDDEEVLEALSLLKPDRLVQTAEVFKEERTIREQLKYQLTDDRVFGKMYAGEILDFMDMEKLSEARKEVAEAKGFTIVYGFGASLVAQGDLLVYLDMARWEIQLRYRKGMGNYRADNGDEDILKKYKRGFFVEWRIADKHKAQMFERMDYLMDTNKAGAPKMISGRAFLKALEQTARQPFRTVPYFDPGVWGGQWMKEVFGLETSEGNYAWSFDGVPEENSLLFNFDGVLVEVPAMDLVLYQPRMLLGEKVYARFGAEFPIRFDFLDTMGGQNLSLQVHPLTEYIKKQFGMQYTQDESYYILDAKEDAAVYLGLKEGVDKEEMIKDLKAAQEGICDFDAEKYINSFPAKKHDHFLIPAGTCHCSGNNVMVLEISATPYIFTFKLWDWGRLGLDGKPRPIHIDHGMNVIQWDRTTKWVEENLVNACYKVKEEEGYLEEHTGLHELEFIETRRYWLDRPAELHTMGTVHMLNLVEGTAAVVESPSGDFEPYEVHYAETFIVPASVGPYRVRPLKEHERISLIKAYVR
ncbi:mannose-6-phosphate isomerase [Lacrimispora indolis]|uniref:mannose-6-phosphate isomerase n=1 Tax=Lacrimispora indolis TaxID=69825 RepID=UPI00040FF73E|nr:mannose-6-phosphate isomerase [[Clostridium] methoxybenzovorans]